MAETMKDAIRKRLKEGYRVVALDDTHYGVCNSDGVCYNASFAIKFRDDDIPSGHFLENIVSQLKRAGAIKEEKHRTSDPAPRPAAHVNHRKPKNAVIIATETLRDTSASPRERALARNYLQLFESHQTVRELAKKLGQRLKELEKLID